MPWAWARLWGEHLAAGNQQRDGTDVVTSSNTSLKCSLLCALNHPSPLPAQAAPALNDSLISGYSLQGWWCLGRTDPALPAEHQSQGASRSLWLFHDDCPARLACKRGKVLISVFFVTEHVKLLQLKPAGLSPVMCVFVEKDTNYTN